MIDMDGRIDDIFANCVSVGSPIIAQRISSSHHPRPRPPIPSPQFPGGSRSSPQPPFPSDPRLIP